MTILLCGVVIMIWYLASQKTATPIEEVSNYKIVDVAIGGEQFNVEVADTKEIQEQGLSGRDGLDTNEGMLFVFEKPGRYSFWMKDMSFSIDMAWIDEKGKILTIAPSVSPDTYPRSFTSNIDAKYVIELPANTLKRLNVNVGDSVSLKI